MAEEVKPGMRFGPLAFTGDEIEIGSELGSGATARVYACRRVRSGEDLAVKVIDIQRYQLLSQSDDLQRLEREVTIVRELRHERCVGLYDIYRSGRWLFLVMERLRGGELFEKILEKKRLTEFETRHIVRQLLEGLSFMHSKHIVHRDLKPENILIASSAEAPPPDKGTLLNIKITDFGLSKFIGAGSMGNTLVGTPQYLAPEVLDGGEYDERVDLWSLGATVYVMLAGKYPFKGENPTSAIRAGRYDMAGGVWANISDAAKGFVRSLLQVNPADRASVETCLKHSWMGGRSSSVEEVTTVVPMDADSLVHNNDIGLTFSPKELVKMQMCFSRSLEAAALACRHSHPALAEKVKLMMRNGGKLAQHSMNMFDKYARVARDVKDKVLPDLALAVQEAIPEAALDFLENVNTWLQDMQQEGEKTMQLSVALADQLHSVILEAQRENLAGICNSDVPSFGSSPIRPMLALQDTNKPQPAPNLTDQTKQLFDELQAMVVNKEAPPGTSTENGTDNWNKQDLVDLLFMAPSLKSPQKSAPQALSPHQGDTIMADAPVVEQVDRVGPQALCIRTPEGVPRTIARQQLAEHPLLRALEDLRRVSQILQTGMAFWMDMSGTVQQLSHFKDHTKTLIMFSAKNDKFRQRFDQRLAEYAQFWNSLMVVCQEFRNEMQPGLAAIHKSVNDVEQVADHFDAGARLQHQVTAMAT